MNWERGDETAFAGPQRLETGVPLPRVGERSDSYEETGNQDRSSLRNDPSQAERSMAAALRAERQAGRRQHICIVTETYPPEINGVALTLGHLAEGLRKIGHRVSLVRPWQRAADAAARPNQLGGINDKPQSLNADGS